MALTASANRQISGGYECAYCNLLMPHSTTIYKGAALTISDGVVRPLTSGAGKKFIGFANWGKTTTAGMTHEEIQVYFKGMALLPVSGATLANICDPVYATDDDTFTMSADGEAVKIGRLLNGISGQWNVEFNAFCLN